MTLALLVVLSSLAAAVTARKLAEVSAKVSFLVFLKVWIHSFSVYGEVATPCARMTSDPGPRIH